MFETAVVIFLLGLYVMFLAGALYTAVAGISKATVESMRFGQTHRSGRIALHH